MNQEVIAGIGNIYSDEILWKAKIHPFKSAGELSVNELNGLYKATKEILKKAVKLRGTSISDYRDTVGKPGAYAKQRFVYRREGELCRRCKIIIKELKLGEEALVFVLNAKNCKKIHFCRRRSNVWSRERSGGFFNSQNSQSRGFNVTAVKIDPYVNVDAGTMNPTEHGEVFVLEDGMECDQDMGNYERFFELRLALRQLYDYRQRLLVGNQSGKKSWLRRTMR